MQKILNSKERWDAFLKFLVFFMITLILVTFAIYFNFRLPSAENKILMAEKENLNQLQVNQYKFILKLKEVLVLKDSLLKDNDQVAPQLEIKTAELTSLSKSADDQSNTVNEEVITLLNNLSDTRKKLKSRDDQLNKTKQDLESIDKKFSDYREMQKANSQ